SSITKYFHGRNQLNASSEALDEKSVLEGIESRPASHQFERGAEEISIIHDLSSFDRFENACKDDASGDIAGEDLILTSGTESCSTSKQNEQQSRYPEKETKLMHSNDEIRSFNPKRKATKEKGTSSILRFLQSNSTSSSKQDSPTPLQETNSLSLGTQEQLNIESQSLNQNVQTTNAWSYKVDEIDQSVIEELPLEIQQE
ncbi:hypothetical protein Tco_1527807, partial [Tanacetum coccineum]